MRLSRRALISSALWGELSYATYFFAACLATALFGPTVAAQEIVPVGNQFQVNTVTTNQQNRTRVGMSDSGDFVVVWDSNAPGVDLEFDVRARRFDSDGVPMGEDFRINTSIVSIQNEGALDVNGEGAFAVVWESRNGDEDVVAQRFDEFGTALGGEIAVNTYTTDDQEDVSVAISEGGELLVVWRSDGSSGADTDAQVILGQRYASDGSPAGGEFEVNSFTTGYQALPDVAVLPGGDFVVVWESAGLDGSPQGYFSSIQGQRFGSDGSRVASEFQISSDTVGLKSSASVAANASGHFSVVWEHREDVGGSFGGELRLQRFEASGAKIGGVLGVDTLPGADPERPRPAVDAAGGVIIVWKSPTSAGDDTSDSSIQIRRFDAEGLAVGPETQVNAYTSGIQGRADIDLNGEGEVVVSWSSFGSFGNDDDGASVQVRRFQIVGSLGGTVWLDDNNDGIFGVEEVGLGGVEVELFDGQGASQDTATTDIDGSYTFAGLSAGPYRVAITLPPGAVAFSPQDIGGDDSIDSDVDAGGETVLIELEVGGRLDVDAGVWRDPLFADDFESGDILNWSLSQP